MPKEPPPLMPTSFNGLNHLKLPSSNILKTHNFYTKIFPFTPLPRYDHFTPSNELFAKMVIHDPTRTILEVRYAPEQAAAQKGWDPITWGVGTREDLKRWGGWFDVNAVRHSDVKSGVKSWLMACEDPDGRIVRLYVEHEEHEWSNSPDQDEFWLGTVRGDPNVNGDGDGDGNRDVYSP